MQVREVYLITTLTAAEPGIRLRRRRASHSHPRSAAKLGIPLQRHRATDGGAYHHNGPGHDDTLRHRPGGEPAAGPGTVPGEHAHLLAGQPYWRRCAVRVSIRQARQADGENGPHSGRGEPDV